MTNEKPLVALLNVNPSVFVPGYFDSYGDTLEFRWPKGDKQVDNDEALSLLPGADACVTCWKSPRLTKELLDVAPDLKIIAHAAGTVVPYVSDEVWHRDIAVVHAADSIAEEVSHYIVALVVIGRRNLMEVAPQLHEGKWRDPAPQVYRPPSDVRGTTVGLIGAGFVGKRVIKLLTQYQIRIVLNDPFIDQATAKTLGVELVDLDELFRVSDVVSVHAPSIPETRHMVNAPRLASMKEGSIFINTSRGPLVDEKALVAELQKKRIWAFLDVTDPEPPASDSILFHCPNLTLSPHVAGSISGSGKYQLLMVLDELARFFKGEPLKYRISREAVEKSSLR